MQESRRDSGAAMKIRIVHGASALFALCLLTSGCATVPPPPPPVNDLNDLPAYSQPAQAGEGGAAVSMAVPSAAPMDSGVPAPGSVAPQGVIYGNSGKYLCPFTEDGVTAKWVDKAVNAKAGGAVGGALGTYAGQKALEQVPFVGGWLGSAVGKKAGREVAILASGGWGYIKETSDLSFESLDQMAAYLLTTNSQHPQYAQILNATYEIYPEFREAYARVAARKGPGI